MTYPPSPDHHQQTPLMLSLTDVARLLSVSSRTVMRLVETGQLRPPTKLGRRSLWPRQAIEEFVEQLSQNTAQQEHH